MQCDWSAHGHPKIQAHDDLDAFKAEVEKVGKEMMAKPHIIKAVEMENEMLSATMAKWAPVVTNRARTGLDTADLETKHGKAGLLEFVKDNIITDKVMCENLLPSLVEVFSTPDLYGIVCGNSFTSSSCFLGKVWFCYEGEAVFIMSPVSAMVQHLHKLVAEIEHEDCVTLNAMSTWMMSMQTNPLPDDVNAFIKTISDKGVPIYAGSLIKGTALIQPPGFILTIACVSTDASTVGASVKFLDASSSTKKELLCLSENDAALEKDLKNIIATM